jgi:hypothetical protein
MIEKPYKLTLTRTRATFHYIGGHRNSRPSHLTHKSKLLGAREARRLPIDRDNQGICKLKGRQLSVVSHAISNFTY